MKKCNFASKMLVKIKKRKKFVLVASTFHKQNVLSHTSESKFIKTYI